MGDIAEAFEEIKRRTLVGLQVVSSDLTRIFLLTRTTLRPVGDPIGSRNWTNAMHVYNARIVEIARNAREVVAFLQSKRNTFVALFRLPPEVICEIMLCLNMRGRLRVSWTSSYLRQISLASAGLWADMDLASDPPRLLRCLLARAGNAPLTLRQGPAAPLHHGNPMRSVTRPSRYSMYACADRDRSHAIPLELVGRWGELLARTEALELGRPCAPRGDGLGFGFGSLASESDILDQPMPQLVALRLRAATLSYTSPRRAAPLNQNGNGNGNGKDNENGALPWFAGTTPRLRHVAFHRLAAPYHDPLYANLVSLVLHYPAVPIAPDALARLLVASPLLRELVLQGALDGSCTGTGTGSCTGDEQPVPVGLAHLARLHIESSRSAFDGGGGARTVRRFLALVRPGAHCKLHIETGDGDLGALPDAEDGAGAFSRVLQHTDTLRVAAVRSRLELHAYRALDVFWSYVAACERGELDAPDLHSPAMLAGLLHVAHTARVPWDRMSTLSVAIADRGVESQCESQSGSSNSGSGSNARALGPRGPPPKPPYHNSFTRLFGKCRNLRTLSISTTNPTAVLVNALSMGCRMLVDISIDGNIKDPILLSLWVQERCSNPAQCEKITRLRVEHRGEFEGREKALSLAEYEELRGDAMMRICSFVPDVEWTDLPREDREIATWPDPWDDVEIML